MYLLSAMGFLLLSIGFLGIFLPVLPTTPFVLLAAGCFAKSSPRLHQWLHNTQLFGSMLKRWEQNRCVSPKTKITAISMIVLFGGSSLAFAVPAGWPQFGTALLLLIGLVSVARLKTCSECMQE
ncbi:YbaN family protein [Paraneptunicella aestuarii]|uniref:YbaN family protein n=1 Tax=Paraneptunicella aestuarii TaxID=2831148 RepID=UPI001E376BEC|nr:YbaN family protein [Paraneptunicella aestuarii]UAA39755.1 YbaN family protein [Paraneptunicella aestuarii]